jgi:hypothetical protein
LCVEIVVFIRDLFPSGGLSYFSSKLGAKQRQEKKEEGDPEAGSYDEMVPESICQSPCEW